MTTKEAAHKIRRMVYNPISGSICPVCQKMEAEFEAIIAETCETHSQYAHMMQEQRSQIAEYCRTLEKQIEALNPANGPVSREAGDKLS